MRKMLVVTSFVAVAVSSPAYALQHQITPLQPSDLTCEPLGDMAIQRELGAAVRCNEASGSDDEETSIPHPSHDGQALADLPSDTHACAGLSEGLRAVHGSQRRHGQLWRRH